MTVRETSEPHLEEGCGQSLTPREDAPEDREEQLLAQLNLQADSLLTPEQWQQLTQLITFHADVFALNLSELGTTTIVAHTIRQPVRKTPFAMRMKIDEMLTQGVIEPSKSS